LGTGTYSLTRYLSLSSQSIQAKAQMAERSIHVTKESTMTSLNDAKKQELALIEDEEKRLDRELAALAGQYDFLVKQAAEFEAEQKRSSDMKAESEEVQRDIAELKSSQEGKSKEAEVSNADLESATKAFEDASKAVDDANAQKLENDRSTMEVLEPAILRKANAIKEKEKIASEVVELQKSIEQQQSDNQETLTNLETKVSAKSNELKEQKTKLDNAHVDFDALKKDDATAQTTLSRELNEYKEFATKFEAATIAERTRLEVQKTERTETRLAHLEKRRSDLGAIEDAQRSDIDNLRELCAYLKEAKKKVATIRDAEVVLDENGDEIEAKNDVGYDSDRDDNVDELEAHAGSPSVVRG